MSTKIVITQSKKTDIDSVPNHIKLQELDGKFIKKIQENHESILSTDSIKYTLDKVDPIKTINYRSRP